MKMCGIIMMLVFFEQGMRIHSKGDMITRQFHSPGPSFGARIFFGGRTFDGKCGHVSYCVIGNMSMRYYTSDYRKYLRGQIKYIKNAIDDPTYPARIDQTEVPHNRISVKQQCMAAANMSRGQILNVKDRIDALSKAIDDFYNIVDRASPSVKSTSKRVLELINEANSALERINEVLKGVGRYQGQAVSVQNLIDAGLPVEKCNELREKAWSKIKKEEKYLDCIHGQVAIEFCEHVVQEIRSNNPLSAEDEDLLDPMCSKYIETCKTGRMSNRIKNIPIIKDLYDHYTVSRYGRFDNSKSMSATTLKNCNDLYEILNPHAAKIMNNFFDNVVTDRPLDTELMEFNVNVIKHDLYTADPELRAVILTYLPKIELHNQVPERVACYSGNKLFLHIDENGKNSSDTACAFFHEFGHALDDLLMEDHTDENGKKISYLSQEYKDAIIDDFTKHINDAATSLGYQNMESGDRDAVIAFIMSQENVNVSSQDKPKYYQTLLPAGWSDEQIKLFTDLRSYYGYREYIYQETGKLPYTCDAHDGTVSDKSKETGTLGDLIGAITNIQIGSVGASHFLDPKSPLDYGEIPNDREHITGLDDVHNVLKNDSHWAHKQGDEWGIGRSAGTEFFAESFNDRIYDVDQTRTKEVFPTVVDMFEEELDDIINGNK